jgi:putative CocE/NonD family hydrolase
VPLTRPHLLTVLAVVTSAAIALPATADAAGASVGRASAAPTQTELYTGTIPADVVAASSAPGHAWTPEAATYGIGSTLDQPVTMADGTVLRVNIYYPTLPSGAAAPGPFPVLLTQTPYGKGQAASASTTESATGGADVYLVQRGYLDVVADVRGTGDSGGNFGLFDPVQTTDGVTLVKYAAALPHSTHEVGLYGPSYLGINQLLTAGAVGPHSALKAIFPLVSADDIYRDTSFMGGITDEEFGAAYLGGITDALNVANPAIDAVQNPTGDPDIAAVLAEHALNVATFNAAFIAGIEANDADAYDGDYWQARDPRSVLANIVANGIPAYLVGGEYDIFQRGEPLNFAGLQNAYEGRPVTAPMSATQPVTGRYQLLDGPFTHLVGSAPKIDLLELEWFDTWLKNENTGMGSTPTPLHYFDIGTNTYAETTRYPLAGETPTRYYLGPRTSGDGALSDNDGSLSATPPTTAAADTMVWSPAGSPCGRSVDQWGLGAYSAVTASLAVTDAPCTADDRTTGAGPSALTYTTPAFSTSRVLAGPISADLYATQLTPGVSDTQWVVEVEDVAPDGASKPLTEGALLGSLRAVDPTLSWTAPDGEDVIPYHPYTTLSQQSVTPDVLTRYQVEVFPTYSTIAAGHRIRITLSSADAPHLAANVLQTKNLVNGVYQVHTGAGGLSSVELPLSAAPPAAGISGSTGGSTTGGSTTTGASTGAAAMSAAGHRGTTGGSLAFTGSDPALPLLATGLLAGAAVAGAGARRRFRRG